MESHTDSAGERWARRLADALRGLSVVSQKFSVKQLIFAEEYSLAREMLFVSVFSIVSRVLNRERKPYRTIPCAQPGGKYMGTLDKRYLSAAYGALHTSPVFTVHPRAVLQLL